MTDEAFVERRDVERLYRAIADREPTRELLQLVFDAFGDAFDLRPPALELKLQRLCAEGESSRG